MSVLTELTSAVSMRPVKIHLEDTIAFVAINILAMDSLAVSCC